MRDIQAIFKINLSGQKLSMKIFEHINKFRTFFYRTKYFGTIFDSKLNDNYSMTKRWKKYGKG